MDGAGVEAILEGAESALTAGATLDGTRFWKAVAAVKGDPALIALHADRIARIDRAALRTWALVTVPLAVGNVLMVGATLVGLVLVAWSYYLEGTRAGLVFLLGFGVVLVTTHGLAHLVAGTLLGMRFTHWFIGSWRQPQPGVKLDYASYLRAPASSRAWMHASGAIVTKAMPIAFLGAAIAADLPNWVAWVLVVGALVAIATDIFWSTHSSDWKRFRREMALAQS